ncbi:hypothetical protein JCM15519_03370 [Fundidesulfovibrio butyratiphilus]
MAGIPFSQVCARMMADPEFRKEYEAQEEEFALIAAMIDARSKAGLTQAQVAERLGKALDAPWKRFL